MRKCVFWLILYFNEEITGNPYNNSSMVIKVWDPVKSVLFLSDVGVEQGDKLLGRPYRNEADCDYIQTAHHRQGFNTHNLTIIETCNTIDSLKITEQWVNFQRLVKIEQVIQTI